MVVTVACPCLPVSFWSQRQVRQPRRNAVDGGITDLGGIFAGIDSLERAVGGEALHAMELL